MKVDNEAEKRRLNLAALQTAVVADPSAKPLVRDVCFSKCLITFHKRSRAATGHPVAWRSATAPRRAALIFSLTSLTFFIE